MTDEALMLEVSKNNIESASALYDRYSKRLYNYFVKISFDRELGNDLLQTTFLRMIKYRNSYREGKSFEAWIFQIARNVAEGRGPNSSPGEAQNDEILVGVLFLHGQVAEVVAPGCVQAFQGRNCRSI